MTVRPKVGALLTSPAPGDASSRLVEAYRLHPNAIKALARCGQGYSLSDEGLAPVAYPMMPALSADYPLPRKDQKAAQGAEAVRDVRRGESPTRGPRALRGKSCQAGS